MPLYLPLCLEGTPEEVLQRLFRTFDVNGDGKISKKEMQVNFFPRGPWYLSFTHMAPTLRDLSILAFLGNIIYLNF